MAPFHGFPTGKVRFTRLPDPFFTELLPEIDDLDELKVTLYCFWRLERMEGELRYLRRGDLAADERLMASLSNKAKTAQGKLDKALQNAVERGTLLESEIELDGKPECYYFLNSGRGRAAVEAIAQGEWKPSGDPERPVQVYLERPNVFRLYEEHIGPLTPMIAEALREAEQQHPPEWIEEAVRIAVENNARKWSYIEAILDRWAKEGRDERVDRRDTQKGRKKYVEGEFSEFVDH